MVEYSNRQRVALLHRFAFVWNFAEAADQRLETSLKELGAGVESEARRDVLQALRDGPFGGKKVLMGNAFHRPLARGV